jgi:hypothetical protein
VHRRRVSGQLSSEADERNATAPIIRPLVVGDCFPDRDRSEATSASATSESRGSRRLGVERVIAFAAAGLRTCCRARFRNATASVVSPWLVDGCFSPAMQEPSHSRPAPCRAIASLRRRPTLRLERSSRLGRPRHRVARNPITLRSPVPRSLRCATRRGDVLCSGDQPQLRRQLVLAATASPC